ncbi:uncharacterized protein LACBIDRAFT_317737 [Laccaria bicolor S238N-H82]|uniref:Predicted protein n=1 Tax=Laccaria bicolor (strain S238N-H82 / ATCC MYA-4686) TaxID=486041 RepID=B0E299_LACBS|nr:uncharacterized protein LACBIDRAFT_317737 [Laccaria bicolor S238N-H82]EDQ99043.1 predicted protein [Laccaria bicolor S238N-H82]|eukprot:XP_001890318.1 predicted protein [Laccaria bicolor S238N-H82]
MKADFEAEFAASGRDKSARASARNDFKLARWRELDDDTQEHWIAIAKTNHATNQKATQDRIQHSGQLDPADAQEVLDELPNFLGPFINVIGEAIGMHITVLVGGPEPRKKGQLNMFGIHYGENKAAVPKVWALAEKEKFNVVSEAFLAYLSTCYTVDEQRARALPQSGSDSTAIHAGPSSSTPLPGTNSTAMHSGPSSLTTPPGPSTENSTTLSNSSGLADGGRKRKRSNETKVKKAQKSRHKTKKGSAKKKPNKRRKATVCSDAEASATDSFLEGSDSGAGTQPEDSAEDSDHGDEDDDEVFTFPGIIHMESIWNPWNPSQIPYGIHGIDAG